MRVSIRNFVIFFYFVILIGADEDDDDFDEEDSNKKARLNSSKNPNNVFRIEKKKEHDSAYKKMYSRYDERGSVEIMHNDVQKIMFFSKEINLKDPKNNALFSGVDYSLWGVVSDGIYGGEITPYSDPNLTKNVKSTYVKDRTIIPNVKDKNGNFMYFDSFDISVVEIIGCFVKSRFGKDFVIDDLTVSFSIPSEMFEDTGIERKVCCVSYKQMMSYLQKRQNGVMVDGKFVTMYDVLKKVDNFDGSIFSYYFTQFDKINVIDAWKLEGKSNEVNRRKVKKYYNQQRKFFVSVL